MKLRTLLSKIKADFLKPTKASIETELTANCTVSSGNQGIPVNVSGVDFKNAIRSHLNGNLFYDSNITCWDVSK
eukprot:scaffold51871_cov72-Attheya_sp.AAC.1